LHLKKKDFALGEKARKVDEDILSVSEDSSRDAAGNDSLPRAIGNEDVLPKAVGSDDGPVDKDDGPPNAESTMVIEDGSFAKVMITDNSCNVRVVRFS